MLGIKTETQASQPAFYVPSYLQRAGFQIIPVPVYYPSVTQILGEPVFRRLIDIPIDIDLVNVFRRSRDVPPHVDDILGKMPKAVWLQSGIRNDAAADIVVASNQINCVAKLNALGVARFIQVDRAGETKPPGSEWTPRERGDFFHHALFHGAVPKKNRAS